MEVYWYLPSGTYPMYRSGKERCTVGQFNTNEAGGVRGFTTHRLRVATQYDMASSFVTPSDTVYTAKFFVNYDGTLDVPEKVTPRNPGSQSGR